MLNQAGANDDARATAIRNNGYLLTDAPTGSGKTLMAGNIVQRMCHDDGIALQRDDWKIHRFGRRLALFNIKDDPNEFFDLQKQQPEKFKSMEAALMTRYNSLPDDGKSPLRNVAEASGQLVYVNGAADGTPADPRYLYPYQDGKPVAYPAPLLPNKTNLSPEQTKTRAERKGQAPVTRKAKAKQREKEKAKTANPSK